MAPSKRRMKKALCENGMYNPPSHNSNFVYWCGVRSMRTTVRVLWRDDDFINGYQDYIAIKAVRIRTREIHPAVGFETSGRLNS